MAAEGWQADVQALLINQPKPTSPQSAMYIFWDVLPLREPSDSMRFTTAMPSVTRPNTTCLPSAAMRRGSSPIGSPPCQQCCRQAPQKKTAQAGSQQCPHPAIGRAQWSRRTGCRWCRAQHWPCSACLAPCASAARAAGGPVATWNRGLLLRQARFEPLRQHLELGGMSSSQTIHHTQPKMPCT